ncbi:MAG: hypothetical protein KatS3mg024_0268 [Armatimonadota bacterium]|nr:MAG: hypothetical protein KatS3mg024_0268 [Armatimonadota bacterium]
MNVRLNLLFAISLSLLIGLALPSQALEQGFTNLFDGRTLQGWQLVGGHGAGYVVRGGLLVCPADGGGILFTDRQYSDFVLRFDFRLDKAGNNGVAIRSALDSNPAYDAMEIQLLDDDDPAYARLEPGQYCGSIYKVAPARRGALKKPGEWNAMEIAAVGRRIRVTLNGRLVVNADLNSVRDPRIIAEHPGIFRDRGYIGFMGHGPSEVSFRNVRIRDLSRPERPNTPPPGFRALFDGKTLSGWKGLVENPPERARMAPQELAAAQAKADERMRQHWKVVDGALVFDGKGDNLCTAQDYCDFELLVDWKIEPGGDSGIYLRGCPQVQIWDNPIGSGGLYNNKNYPSNPSKRADRPAGQWNRFRIVMVGEKVHVFLNGELVVKNMTMDNYWERERPIYPCGQIELQNHGNTLYFRNIYIRPL